MTRERFIEELDKEQESLRRFLLVMCNGDSFTADDIAQEASVKAYLSMSRFEERSKFSTWLFRIGYNCWINYTRRRKVSENHPECIPECIPDDSGQADKRYEYEKLYMAIDKLSEAERVATVLFYMEDKSLKEIVSITGLPLGTVCSHLARARKHLKAFLRDERY